MNKMKKTMSEDKRRRPMPRNYLLAFRTSEEVKEAIELLAKSKNISLSKYLHDVITQHYVDVLIEDGIKERNQ
jgi:predicted HicB family RNase H-like nuclease